MRRAGGAVTALTEAPARSSSATSTSTSSPARCDARGNLLTLTAREFDLLVYLASRPRRACRREELLEQVWGFTYGDTATVTVHVRRIREKIEADPGEPRHLTTVWGVGYRWDP